MIKDTVLDVVKKVVDHHKAHPDHGLDCACMDRHIQQLRSILWGMTKDVNIQRRINYVIRAALER